MKMMNVFKNFLMSRNQAGREAYNKIRIWPGTVHVVRE